MKFRSMFVSNSSSSSSILIVAEDLHNRIKSLMDKEDVDKIDDIFKLDSVLGVAAYVYTESMSNGGESSISMQFGGGSGHYEAKEKYDAIRLKIQKPEEIFSHEEDF